MSPRTALHRFAFFGLLGTVTAAGCHDAPRLLEPETSMAVPAPPALSAARAAALAVGLDDALTRLLPAAAAEHDALRHALETLNAALAAGDAATLRRHLAAARRALAAQSMEIADADALRLALDELAQAVGSAGSFD